MSTVQEEIDAKIEIQKTLISINDVTLKIKKELDIINELVKENGPLPVAVSGAKETLKVVAQDMGIKMDELSEDGEGSQFKLASTVIPDLTEKLLSCIEN